MELIRQYAGLAMVCGAAMLILPQGGLRRTASLAIGLVVALFWLTGLRGYLRLPAVPAAPDTLLTPAASAGADYAALISRIASAQAGAEITLTWENGGLAEGR